MVGTSWKRPVLRLLTVLAVLVAPLALVGSVDAAPPKTYTAAAQPTKLALGTGQRVALVYTNTTKNDIDFDAANIVVPVGLDIADPTVTTFDGTATVTYDATARRLEVRTLGVGTRAPDNTFTVEVTITTDVAPTCSSYVWASDVRQSNNFNGTLNKFSLVGAEATMTTPCSSSSVTCTAGDDQICSTGTIVSPAGSSANVVVEDSDTVSAQLTASLGTATYQCAEYTSSSDQLLFDIDITNGVGTDGLTKTVTFTGPTPDGRESWEYQVCFLAPYDFPALLPSELLQDFNTGDFSGNTQPEGTEFKGLLLPCSAGEGAPCVLGRSVVGDQVTVTVSTPVADPRLRY
jgi:hypothetical protein